MSSTENRIALNTQLGSVDLIIEEDGEILGGIPLCGANDQGLDALIAALEQMRTAIKEREEAANATKH